MAIWTRFYVQRCCFEKQKNFRGMERSFYFQFYPNLIENGVGVDLSSTSVYFSERHVKAFPKTTINVKIK
ncbi:CLUMA_CG011340, isoform A [Clunio marinus]|uniref:CLUMA_CG011340, isoform A n=1 Tax=Clunio marinus TaxID=568069 RepID=A0A1J1ICK9_9DIPT|nr:CLUMA_CG011340, isoform A [Clunio marinus]